MPRIIAHIRCFKKDATIFLTTCVLNYFKDTNCKNDAN